MEVAWGYSLINTLKFKKKTIQKLFKTKLEWGRSNVEEATERL